MAKYSAPGVYVRETDESLYVRQSASAVAGFIGIADKGPIGVATLVTNWAQFVETFGGFRADSWLAYAVKAFFDNGGGVCYITRTVHYADPTDPTTATSAAATVDIVDSGALPALTVTAKSPGLWAEGYTVEVTNLVADGGGTGAM